MAVNQQFHTQIYDLDYYSSAQCFLYIGDVWVDEITALQYETRQTKTPIYGYASQLYDDHAAGHVIVQGSFAINFKEQGYLWAVLRRYKNIVSDIAYGVKAATKNTKFKDQKLGVDISGQIKDRRPVWGSNGTRVNRESIERVVQGNASRGEEYEFYQDLSGYATFNVNSPKDKVFEDIVEEFEDQVWSKGITNFDLNNQLRRTDDNRFDGFDMYVMFGNYSSPGANHTVQKIIDVCLLSQGKMIQIDGKPVQEQYDFFAQSTA